MFEKLERFWTTLFVSVLGVALSAAPSVVNGYTGNVGVLGNAFAPIAGILIADYVVIKRTQVDIVALFERGGPYWYWGGFNLVAIGWTAIGFVLCTLFVPVAWIPTMVAMIATGLCYYAAVWILSTRLPAVGRAARPGEQRESAEQLTEEIAVGQWT